MKDKFFLINILFVFALLMAACAAQQTNNDGGATATIPAASSPVVDTPTEGTAEDTMTPTGAAESVTPGQIPEGTAMIPQTGPGDVGVPDDLDEVVRVLREAGATVELGDAAEQDFLAVPGQTVNINGEETQFYTYNSAEELEVQVSHLQERADTEDEPHFYKLGSMLVRYVGTDPGVRDLLEDVLGAQATGQ